MPCCNHPERAAIVECVNCARGICAECVPEDPQHACSAACHTETALLNWRLIGLPSAIFY
ncbi:hypothetical protein [Tumebacillus flagellatus]|uniref:B box-type domain-containing protein n=1 Tax=Tumebacillus flagellatus TaxID=1157490 RepID=A0A074LM04_9BACL|nr:hypothetical protein [Tumebacillus flagellatus]KEO80938.1 hypothetical protein EL26_23475 [Tumebacillus flagellatus]